MRAVSQQLSIIPREVKVFQNAIYNHNASLYEAEKLAQQENSQFNLADWVSGEGWYGMPKIDGTAYGPGAGDIYLAQEVEKRMATVQQAAAETKWRMGDREGAKEISAMDMGDFAKNHMDDPHWKQQDPLNANIQEEFRAADLRYRDQMLSDHITDIEEELRMKSEINKDFNQQLGEQLDTIIANEPDSSFAIGDEVFGLDATLVKADRVWDEVDTQLDQMLKNRAELYRDLENTMAGINVEGVDIDADALLERPEWQTMNRTSKLDFLARDLQIQRKALRNMRNMAEEHNAAELIDDFDQMALDWEASTDQWKNANHDSMEALDELIEKVGKKPLPKEMQSEFNEMYDHVANREWSSAETDISLQGLGADGLVNDAYNTFGTNPQDMLGTFRNSGAAEMIESARESNLEEYKAGDVDPYELEAPIQEGGGPEYDDMLEEPLLGDPEAAALNPNLELPPNFNAQAGMELAQATMMDFLGMVPLGLGGLLSIPDTSDWDNENETYHEYEQRKRDEAQKKVDFDRQRSRRQALARETWIDRETYVNIANRWYKATVKDLFLASAYQPQTRFEVEVEWDDKDGKTMDYTIPASSDRIRLQDDGPPPLREGGITRYEPFTDPQDVKQTRHVDDILPLEQVFVDGRWREVKEVNGRTLTMSDGYKFTVWEGYPPQWRARGVIHGPDNPKNPKFDPKAATGTMMFDSQGYYIPYKPKSGPKGRLQAYLGALQEGEEEVVAEDKHSYDEINQKFLEYMASLGIYPDDHGPDNPKEPKFDTTPGPMLDEDGNEIDPKLGPKGKLQAYWDKWWRDHPDETIDTETHDEDFYDAEYQHMIDEGLIDPEPEQPVTPEEPEKPVIPEQPEKPVIPEQPEKPVNQETGHIQEDIFPGTAESMKHKIQTGGFHALEKELGMSMPEIYENYALGNFDWQHDSIVPEWLQPNLSKLHGGTEQYESLINKYSDDYQMMRNLERVGTAVRAPGVLNYLDTAHNELRTVYHNGLSHDQIHNITQSNMPNFSYNSAGHIVLQDDLTIDHQFNHNRAVVHSIDSTGATTEHTQLDFQKVAAEHQQQHHS